MSRELKIGDLIGNYEILSVLSQGRFGITYLAYDKGLDRKVAIKEYFPKEFSYRTKNKEFYPTTTIKIRQILNGELINFLKSRKSNTF